MIAKGLDDIEVRDLQSELRERGEVPSAVREYIGVLPRDMHPMSMLSSALIFLQKDSVFAREYAQGKASKNFFWELYFEDAMDLIAKIPRLAAFIYRHKYHQGKFIDADNTLDWAANYAHMLGYDQFEF